MAKGKSKSVPSADKAPKESSKGSKMADNVRSQMPAGSPQAPGPINDPSNHPVDNIPEATDPRWAEMLQAQGAQGGM